MRPPSETPASPAASAGPALNVLCVCTGNIARSPVLARLLDLATDESVHVTSAGTGALTGASMDPSMVSLLEASGVSSVPFQARDLTESLIVRADLVLCLDTSHRRRVVQLAPAAMRRTFLLRELARLATGAYEYEDGSGHDDAARLRALVAAVLPYRGGLGSPEQDDVADPFGGSAAGYQAAFADIASAVIAIKDAAGCSGSRSDAVPSPAGR